MRIFLSIFASLILLVGCNQNGIDDASKRNENWAWFVDEKRGEGVWVPLGDSTTLDDGDYTLFFCNGKIRQTGKLKDGKDCDTIFQFDLEEKLISKIIMLPDSTLKEFMPDGKYKSYYSTCEISGEGEFKGNKQIGTRLEYYKNGKIKYKSIVDFDTLYVLDYYESGKMQDSARLVKGEYDGAVTYYYENGQIESFRTYVNGDSTGASCSYYENGQINQKGSRYHGLADDTITDWFENGQMAFIRYYIKGEKEGEAKMWFSNGKIKLSCNFNKDKKHGMFKEYFENGTLAKEGNYNHGQKTGEWRYYDEKGKLIDTKQN